MPGCGKGTGVDETLHRTRFLYGINNMFYLGKTTIIDLLRGFVIVTHGGTGMDDGTATCKGFIITTLLKDICFEKFHLPPEIGLIQCQQMVNFFRPRLVADTSLYLVPLFHQVLDDP